MKSVDIQTRMPPLVLLAGGLATRLQPLTKDIPKAMIMIEGTPFIAHQLNLLKEKGLKEIIICVGHHGRQIEDYLKNGRAFGLKITFSYDGKKLLGTGGALRKALPFLEDVFWIMYGDSYLDIDFLPILNHFLSHSKMGLMTVLQNNNQWDKSNILFKDGQIQKHDKKEITPDMRHIDYGLSLLRKEVLQEVSEEVFDLSELYTGLIGRNEMLGYEVDKRFYEIGSIEGLKETEIYIKNR